MESKLLTEFNTSKRCVGFVKELMGIIRYNTIEDVREFVSSSYRPEDLKNYLSVLESEYSHESCNTKKFKYHEITYGNNYYDSMKVSKSLYIIDIYDILASYMNNSDLRHMLECNYSSNNPSILKSFFDGDFYQNQPPENLKIVYLALYADEINLINPIGIYIYLEKLF